MTNYIRGSKKPQVPPKRAEIDLSIEATRLAQETTKSRNDKLYQAKSYTNAPFSSQDL